MIALLALLVAFAAPPDPSPQPSTLDLPEIGRVRAISSACGAMRDLVIPAFSAAREADKHFDTVSKTLPEYVRGIAEDSKYNPDPPVVREMRLSRLGMEDTKMLKNAKTIADALGDPRLAKNSKDPDVQAERQQLQSLYESQINRVGELNQYVMREQNATALLGVGSTDAFKGRNSGRAPSTPEPRETTTPYGMPKLGGKIGYTDAESIRDWTNQMSALVKSNEIQVAKSFYTIAKSCQGK